MQNILEQAQTPEAWSQSLSSHGVHVSPRLIRSKAHKTGHFHKIGRLMLITPAHLEALIANISPTGETADEAIESNETQQTKNAGKGA